MIGRIRFAFLLSLTLLGLSSEFSSAWAQQGVKVNMDDESQWTIVQDDDATAAFGFDYSVYGIPNAPGGDDSLGILLRANSAEPAEAAAISVSPNNISLSGEYSVSVDMWLNFYADFDKIGTTEFGGLQVGFDSTQSNPINGAGLFGDTDGDTSRDYRLYKNDVEQDLESGQYEIVSNDNADIDLLEEFLGQEVPAEQTDIDVFDPPNEDFLAFDGTLAFGWHKIQAAVDSESGTATFVIDDLPIGTVDNNIGEPVSLSGGVALSLWDIFSSVSPVPEFSFAVFDNLVVEGSLSIPGDFDGDSELTSADIDLLAGEIKSNGNDSQFDLNGDGSVSLDDHRIWVSDLKGTFFGDANLDGEFSSADLVTLFAAGEYEDGVPMNSTWSTGDFDADGDFGSGDLVAAFADGGYELGPKAAASPVPEPTSLLTFALGLLGFALHRRLRS